MAEHTVFGSGAPPWEPANFDNGTPIVTACAFYSTATAWYVLGARLRVPAADQLPSEVTLALRTSAYETLIDLSTPAITSGVAQVAEGWIEARWSPIQVPAVTVAWVSLEQAGDFYVYADVPHNDPVQAVDMADLYLAENGVQRRAAFREGSGSTLFSTAWYGLDLIVSDTISASGGSSAGVIVSSEGLGLSGRRGSSSTQAGVSAEGSGSKLAMAGSSAGIVVSSQGAGYNPAGNAGLPVHGIMTNTTPGRDLVALTPGRNLEAR